MEERDAHRRETGEGDGPGGRLGEQEETVAAPGVADRQEPGPVGEEGIPGPGDAAEPEKETSSSGLEEEPGEGEGAAILEEVERLRQESEQWRQRALRMQADFENFRRRTRQEREEWSAAAAMKLLEQMLPVLDNLELALRTARDAQDVQSVLQGVEMVVRQFREVLQREGVEAIEAVGQPFDPTLHEAVVQESDPSRPPGTVIEELRKGYRYKDKVLRPAMVKVNG